MGSHKLVLVDANDKQYGYVSINFARHLSKDIQNDIGQLSG
jgi:hypothetical protein